MIDNSKEENEFRNFDLHAPNHHDGVECVWEKMRKMPELPYSEKYGGFYVVTRHADLRKVAAKHDIYSSASGIALPDEDRSNHIPAEVDPPIQKEYRALLTPFLTAEEVAKAEPMVRNRAKILLDGFKGETRLDFVERFAKPFPVQVALEFFGFPVEDAEWLDQIIKGLLDHRGTEKGKAASINLTDYIESFLREKEATAKKAEDDIMSSIVLGTVQGRRLDMEEKMSITRLLLFGGFTTTMNALAYTLNLFAERPEIVDRLRTADDGLWTTAVDELVRISSPATYLRRTVTQQTELGGTQLCPGDRVLMCFASANRDPEAFSPSDDVVLDRKPNPHVGFGHGTHRCLGSWVAKLEMKVALEEILQRYSHFEHDPEGKIVWETGETQGIASLPLILHPASGTSG